MSNNAVDPLQALQAALAVPPNSKEQADLLASLRESLESHPAPIPVLVDYLIRLVVGGEDSLLKKWILDLLHFAISRSTLSVDVRTQMSLKALDTLAQLVLEDSPKPILKTAIQCLATVYGLVFRHLCSNRSNPAPWNILTSCKTRIVELLWSPSTSAGVKLSSMKFVQKVVLVQMRGVSDPRLQNKNDPNISNCPSDHPFINVPKLEQEGQKLLEGLITMLYTSQDVDLLTALVNSWANLAKLRPQVVHQILLPTLKQWTPAALVNQSALGIRSVEKAIRILLINISRTPGNSQLVPQINEILSQQAMRMERAASEEKKRRTTGVKRPPSAAAEQPSDSKRIKLEPSPLASFDFTTLPAPLITDLIVANLEAFSEAELIALVEAYRQIKGIPAPAPSAPAPAKAIPTGPRAASSAPAAPPEAPASVRRSETPLVAEVQEEPVDPLQMDIDQEEIEFEPERLNEELADTAPAQEEVAPVEVDIKQLQLKLSEFKLPAPPELDEEARAKALDKTLSRLWTASEELKGFMGDTEVDVNSAGGSNATEMWMLLVVRMITRVAAPPGWGKKMNKGKGREGQDGEKEVKDAALSGVSERDASAESAGKSNDEEEAEEDHEEKLVDFYVRQDRLRQTLCNYIMTDFPSRMRLATTWMNEEWYNDRIRLAKDPSWRSNYDTWLNQIVAGYQTILDGKDRAFAKFLLDLPSIPGDVLDLLRDLCVDSASSERMQVGYSTLRGMVVQRPSMRFEALNVLLELTTHPDKRTRAAAINTVKVWVNTPPLDNLIRAFALQMLRKLQRAPSAKRPPTPQPSSNPNEDHEMADAAEKAPENQPNGRADRADSPASDEDGQLPEIPEEDLVQTPYLPERIELPADKAQVLQHLELMFALSVKVPPFLNQIFDSYAQMDPSVQEAVESLLTPLIRSLGSNHSRLLNIMKNCPRGSESLALRVLTIFTEYGRPSSQLVTIVKTLITERNLDAKFLIPIIAEMDKADITRYLPRIVSILDGKPETKNLVKQVFNSVVTTPPQSFGSVTSNMPRVRQSELLTPAELMVLLHKSEKEIGLKAAKEAIGICFSMTDVFRSEILAVVMQQIMDEPVLPTLFLRTVIQAVTTYKSLVGFVSTALLSRLIIKKIWTNPPLWEGFIWCAKVIAPASFNALLQLPKDQLRELVDKQPSLKAGLRDYVTKKAPNKARVAGFLDIFGDGSSTSGTPTAATASSPAPVGDPHGEQTSAPGTPRPDGANTSMQVEPPPNS